MGVNFPKKTDGILFNLNIIIREKTCYVTLTKDSIAYSYSEQCMYDCYCHTRSVVIALSGWLLLNECPFVELHPKLGSNYTELVSLFMSIPKGRWSKLGGVCLLGQQPWKFNPPPLSVCHIGVNVCCTRPSFSQCSVIAWWCPYW